MHDVVGLRNTFCTFCATISAYHHLSQGETESLRATFKIETRSDDITNVFTNGRTSASEASWILLTDMYDKRADIHKRLAERMRRARDWRLGIISDFLFLFT